ncbi:MAG: XdhC family protein [Pegethrix bostrychoides GSE-TBD4-15B]|jgi:xanthine dehydrogenase accessory factor|uniref:XdhC family protein n=1 Tax=Pegethrix bostrychoides GSE-TBD4-15B TaxID=2839662 RepID=A0A951P963_9CYAN|nr:XdhC family protein [Pegethrix bostrychoides GSE-TBD4-15B]
MFYEALAAALSQGGAAVVATVTHTKGSVPREVGAKMLILPDGRCIDTIGGGAGEAKVIRQALELLQTGQKQVVEIDLTGAPDRETSREANREASREPRKTEGICGGWMQVWLEHWQGEAAIALVNQILVRLRLGQSITLVTPYGMGLPYLSDDQPANACAETCAETFVETLQPAPMLLIVGAGHVGEQLAKVAQLSGFQITVQDDRPDWANPERYPQAVIYPQLDQALAQLSGHPQLYVALVTRGYRYDLAALTALLERDLPCSYIGMIGSLRRVRQVYEQVEQTGIPAAKLAALYAPIGLDIGALTPAEIAVSITAELILVRRGGTGRPLRQNQTR